MHTIPSRPSEVPLNLLETLVGDLVSEAYFVPDSIRCGWSDTEAVQHALAAVAYSRAIEPDLSPHPDRCWLCAERTDAEGGGPVSRLVAAGVVLVSAALALVGCQPQQATPPPTVIVNTPAADGGLSVLLTVMIGVALLAVIVAGAFAWCWASERRARREAERTVEVMTLALTGRPTQTRAELLQRAILADQPVPGTVLDHRDGGFR